MSCLFDHRWIFKLFGTDTALTMIDDSFLANRSRNDSLILGLLFVSFFLFLGEVPGQNLVAN